MEFSYEKELQNKINKSKRLFGLRKLCWVLQITTRNFGKCHCGGKLKHKKRIDMEGLDVYKLVKTLESFIKKEKKVQGKKVIKLEYPQTINKYQKEAKTADKLYKAYITDDEKINGRFLASQTIKLDTIIDQNNKIIELLKKIAESFDGD